MYSMRKISFLSAAALAALSTLGWAEKAEAQATTTWSGAPETREGEQRFKMRARFQYDVISSDTEGYATEEEGTRSSVRRAFLGAQGRLNNRWRYKVDFVLNPSSGIDVTATSTQNEGEVGVDDAFLEYAGDWVSVIIGEANVTSPLEDRISSLDIPFNERSSFINAFGYGRAAGVALLANGGNWSLAGAVQGDSLNNRETSYAANELLQVSARGTWAPIFDQTPEGVTLVHLGASVRMRDGESALTYSSRPLNGRGSTPISAGISGTDDTSYGVELAAQYNRFGVSAEYSVLEGTETAATGGSDYEFSGYYVDASFSLTGEPRSYRPGTGAFAAVAPRRPLGTDGGIGYWAITARYDSLDLTDTAAAAGTQGEQTSYAVGLDWSPVEFVLFKLNYAHSEFEFRSGAADDEADIISLRSQFAF